MGGQMGKGLKKIIKEMIDCCFDCAERGEAIMCEQGKLFNKCKVINNGIQEILALVPRKKTIYHSNGYYISKINNEKRGYNQAITDTLKALGMVMTKRRSEE